MTTDSKDLGASCEAQLDGLRSLTNAGIFSTDADLNITSWNYWLEVHARKTSQQALGRNLLDLFPEIAERGLNVFYTQALRGQVVVLSQPLHQYLLRLPTTAESQFAAAMPQSVKIAPLIDDGAIVGTLTMVEDVTERVVRESELSIRARQQAAVAALSREALAGGELQGLFERTVSIISETLEVEHSAIFEIEAGGIRLKAGLAGSADPGESVDPLGPGLDSSAMAHIESPIVVADFKTDRRFAVPKMLQDAGVLSAILVPISCSGRVCAILGLYMTRPRNQSTESLDFLKVIANTLGTAIERESLERDLRDRARELVAADQRKNEFLAMLAHELRNPLAPIRSAAQLLYAKNAVDDDIRAVCKVLDRQVGQMTRLVDDLLDISRITRGKIELRLDTVDFAQVVSQAVENSRPQIDAHQHELSVSVPAHQMLVLADADRISQAIANLVNNAAKYTDPHGKISVIVQHQGAEVVTRVRDNGIGISAEMLPQIFGLFTQVDHSLARSEGGLGIGLTLVRTIIEMHGGSVEAFSEGTNQGSEFVVRLPVLSAHGDVRDPAPQPPLPQNHAPPRRVLIVDDNRDAADTLTRLLKVLGHEARSVHDGFDALEEIRRYSPDLVLLDIGLPGMDGFEVARELRKIDARSKMTVIALSGYSDEIHNPVDSGFDMHLVKPIDLRTLHAILAKASPR